MKCSVLLKIPALMCVMLFITACGSSFSGTTEETKLSNTGITETSTLPTTVPISQTSETVHTTNQTSFQTRSTSITTVSTSAATSMTVVQMETTAVTLVTTTVTEPVTTIELQTTVTEPPTETITTEHPAERYADTPALQVAFLVNMEREKYGLVPLLYSDKLGEMAQLRANEILTAFGHTRPDGRSCFSIFDDYQISYRAIAENIAAGQETPDVAIEWWMNSEIHRNNILNPDFRYIGVGNVTQDGVQYWTQIFADADGLDGFIIIPE